MSRHTNQDLSVVILTGGQATRMRPLSLDCSKPMLPFLGRPLLAHLLEDLSSSGLRRVLLTHPGRGGDIQLHFGDGRRFGVNLEYLEPRQWTGTAGLIMALLDQAPGRLSSPFLVIYGDSLLRMSFQAVVDFHRSTAASMTIACHRPRFDAFLFDDGIADHLRTNFGIAQVEPDGRVTHFEEKPLLETIPSAFSRPMANAAVYVVDPEALRAVPKPDQSNLDFAYDVIPQLVSGNKKVVGIDIAPGQSRSGNALPLSEFSTRDASR